MDVERDVLIKFGAPVVATVVFIAVVLAAGAIYGTTPSFGGTGTPNGTATPAGGTPTTVSDPGVVLGETGAFALVALLLLFVVGMAVVGALVSRATADEDDE